MQKIVIAGCTRGIGRAMVLRLKQLGHSVYGCGSSNLHVNSLIQETKLDGHFSVVDVCDSNQVSEWMTKLTNKIGAPDRLIHCAGVINQPGHFADIEKEAFDRVIEVNVTGVANVLRSFLPGMIHANKGIIINISSGAGISGYPNISPYCTSKFAVEGLSKSIAKELPDQMACIPLSPGVINTELLQGYWGNQRADQKDTPEQWAEYAVPFILKLGPNNNGESVRIPQ